MSTNAEPRIYRYILTTDDGAAPNPFGGFCTLAICKPGIRRTARHGDWVLGFQSRAHDRLIYAMEVQECLTFARYWKDPRFKRRRPSDRSIPTDNIYKPSGRMTIDGAPELVWVPNNVHEKDHQRRDLSGKSVLIAERFWYFGSYAAPLPARLAHLQPHSRGHVVQKNRRPDDVNILRNWLSVFELGMQSAPTHPSREGLTGVSCSSHVAAGRPASTCSPVSRRSRREC
jgi:hypothetical protein